MDPEKQTGSGENRKENPGLSVLGVQLFHVWAYMIVCLHVQTHSSICLSLGTICWGVCSVLARVLHMWLLGRCSTPVPACILLTYLLGNLGRVCADGVESVLCMFMILYRKFTLCVDGS